MPTLGHTIHRHGSVASTNDIAAELARSGCEEGVAILAETQTAGRGRHGHTWASPPGGLYLSLVLRPDLPPANAQILGFAAAVAVCDAVAEVCGLSLHTKWPNDLLSPGHGETERGRGPVRPDLRPRKAGGILLEVSLRGAQIEFAIVGIGINVNTDPQALPPSLRADATSLAAEAGRPVDAEALWNTILHHLGGLYDALDSEDILHRWRARATFLGQRIRVERPGSPLTGTAEAVDLMGRLVLRLDDGSQHRLAAGEVHVLDWENPSNATTGVA